MRELFEDQGIQQPSDPLEAARQNSRPVLPKRFYKEAGIAPRAEGDGFAIALDGRTIRTPAKRVWSRRIARSPMRSLRSGMRRASSSIPRPAPLTRLASVIDGITDRTADVAADIAKFFSSDLLFYRARRAAGADRPADSSRYWCCAWITHQFGARFVLAEGIMPVAQPDQAVAAMRRLLPDRRGGSGAACRHHDHGVGPCLMPGLMLAGSGDADTIWRAANIDEDGTPRRGERTVRR